MSRSAHLWRTQIRQEAQARFGRIDFSSHIGSGADDGDLLQWSLPHLYSVLRYALAAVGYRFTSRCVKDCVIALAAGGAVAGKATAPERRLRFKFTFSLTDVEEGPVRTKHMSVVDLASAKMLVLEARRATVDPAASRRLLSMAIYHFGRALLAEPGSVALARERALARAEREEWTDPAKSVALTLF